MKIQLALLVAAMLQTGVAWAADGAAGAVPRGTVCHWRATQQSGIPVRMCLSRQQWAQRVAYTQQAVREYQARSFVHR